MFVLACGGNISGQRLEANIDIYLWREHIWQNAGSNNMLTCGMHENNFQCFTWLLDPCRKQDRPLGLMAGARYIFSRNQGIYMLRCRDNILLSMHACDQTELMMHIPVDCLSMRQVIS